MFSRPHIKMTFISFTIISNVAITTQKFVNNMGAKFFGNEMFTKFVEERMKAPEEKRIDSFANIPKSKIQTRLEKVKVKNNTLDVMKVDRQAFGLLVGKHE